MREWNGIGKGVRTEKRRRKKEDEVEGHETTRGRDEDEMMKRMIE